MNHNDLAILIEDKLREDYPGEDFYADIVMWLDEKGIDNTHNESDVEYLASTFEMERL